MTAKNSKTIALSGSPKGYRTTKIEEDFFIRRVFFWQELLNLMDWRFDIYVGDTGPDKDAAVTMGFSGRVVSIMLRDQTPTKWTKKRLDQIAFHECCEVLLGQLGYWAEQRYSKNEVEEGVHMVIRVLENAVVPKIRGKL
jgi:hypothetical protein